MNLDLLVQWVPLGALVLGVLMFCIKIFTPYAEKLDNRWLAGWTAFWAIVMIPLFVNTYIHAAPAFTWAQVQEYVFFLVFIFVCLTIDQVIGHRNGDEGTTKSKALWSLFWIGMSLLVNGVVFIDKGQDAGVAFFTGYLIEKSLSVDNLFVFLAIFSYFKVPSAVQRKVLFLGIIGAIFFRGGLIALGSALMSIPAFIYVMGAILGYSAYKMYKKLGTDEIVDVENLWILKQVRKVIPMTSNYEGSKFITRDAVGGLMITPLLAVVVIVETTDIVFAVDSIPAIFGITRDPEIVFMSNMCAILGLRALFFLLEDIIDKFYYLQHGVIAVLAFIAVKMLLPIPGHFPVLAEHAPEFLKLKDLAHGYHIPMLASLAVVGGLLTFSVVLSLFRAPTLPEADTPIERVEAGYEQPGIL